MNGKREGEREQPQASAMAIERRKWVLLGRGTRRRMKKGAAAKARFDVGIYKERERERQKVWRRGGVRN